MYANRTNYAHVGIPLEDGLYIRPIFSLQHYAALKYTPIYLVLCKWLSKRQLSSNEGAIQKHPQERSLCKRSTNHARVGSYAIGELRQGTITPPGIYASERQRAGKLPKATSYSDRVSGVSACSGPDMLGSGLADPSAEGSAVL